MQMCSAAAPGRSVGRGSPNKVGSLVNPKTLVLAPTATLLPRSWAVTGNQGWVSQPEGAYPTWSIPALPEPNHTAETGHRHGACRHPGTDRQTHRDSWASTPSSSQCLRIPQEISALPKPNHRQGHDLNHHVTRAVAAEGKTKHGRT